MRAFWNKLSISGAIRDARWPLSLANSYRLLIEDGGRVSRNDIERDITRLFRSNAESWMNFNKS